MPNKPLRRASRLAALISAIGVSIFLSTFVQLMRGAQTTRFPQLFEFKMYSLGNIA